MANHRSKRKSDEEISMLRCFEFKVESFKYATIQLVDELTDKKEKILAKQWLGKLFRELLRSGERSADALEYLFFLMCSLQTREPLEHPFTQPPPDIDSRLIPLHYELDTFTYTENLRSLKNDLNLDRYLRKEKEAKSRTKTLLEQMMRPTELNMYPTKKDRALAAASRPPSQPTKNTPVPSTGAPRTRSVTSHVHYSEADVTQMDEESKMIDGGSFTSGDSKKSGGSKRSGKSRKSKGSRKSEDSLKRKDGPERKGSLEKKGSLEGKGTLESKDSQKSKGRKSPKKRKKSSRGKSPNKNKKSPKGKSKK